MLLQSLCCLCSTTVLWPLLAPSKTLYTPGVKQPSQELNAPTWLQVCFGSILCFCLYTGGLLNNVVNRRVSRPSSASTVHIVLFQTPLTGLLLESPNQSPYAIDFLLFTEVHGVHSY